jgi:hypothetical protein
MHDREAEPERGAWPTLGDVAAVLLVRDVVRAFRQLRREDARDGAGRDAGRAGATRVCDDRVETADAEEASDDAADSGQRAGV